MVYMSIDNDVVLAKCYIISVKIFVVASDTEFTWRLHGFIVRCSITVFIIHLWGRTQMYTIDTSLWQENVSIRLFSIFSYGASLVWSCSLSISDVLAAQHQHFLVDYVTQWHKARYFRPSRRANKAGKSNSSGGANNQQTVLSVCCLRMSVGLLVCVCVLG